MSRSRPKAVALWLLHTLVFDRFPITPRLALLSPVDGCRKTTLLVLIEQLVAEAYRTDNITPAAVYHHLDRRPRTTLLVDEGDKPWPCHQCRAALGLQFRAPVWWERRPIRWWLVAEIFDFFSPRGGGDWFAALAAAAPGGAIADNLGYGEPARRVTLLADIRIVFQARGVDRIASADLVDVLLGLDDGRWNEWRGPNDDRSQRKLTQGELSRLLRPFGIRPKTIWPARRRPGDKSSRGYLRSQFEKAWRAYCPSPDTPT